MYVLFFKGNAIWKMDAFMGFKLNQVILLFSFGIITFNILVYTWSIIAFYAKNTGDKSEDKNDENTPKIWGEYLRELIVLYVHFSASLMLFSRSRHEGGHVEYW